MQGSIHTVQTTASMQTSSQWLAVHIPSSLSHSATKQAMLLAPQDKEMYFHPATYVWLPPRNSQRC
jgi:hypothetical protein